MSESPTQAAQSFEKLQERWTRLDRQRTTAEANLETAKKQLDDLKAAAHKEYGTDDLEQLRQKLAAMEAENLQKRDTYQQELDKIEADLRDVEQKHTQPAEQK